MTLKKYGWNENATINNSPEIYACRMLFQSFFIYLFLSRLGKQVQIIIFPIWYTEKKKMDQNQNIWIKRIATLWIGLGNNQVITSL